MIGRRTFRQDAEPAEWIVSLEHAEHPVGNTWSADAVESVAAGNEIAIDFLRPAVMLEADVRPLRFQIVHRDVVDLKQKRRTIGKSALHEILHDFLLPIDCNTLVHQFFEINAVQVAVDADIDSPVQHSLALHAATDAYVGEQVGGPMLD